MKENNRLFAAIRKSTTKLKMRRRRLGEDVLEVEELFNWLDLSEWAVNIMFRYESNVDGDSYARLRLHLSHIFFYV